jgi:succinate dehydrogenase flavin-adding protein (antitoxin of CptAB toxin-antitoxin module)
MDYLLSKFADAEIHKLNWEELRDYEALLDEEDPYIYDWIMSKKEIPAEFLKIINRIKNFHNASN